MARELEDHSPSLAEQLARAQTAESVSAALARLPTIERHAVRLHYILGLSIAETAAKLGLRLFTTQNILARARRELGRILRPMYLA